jgi:hypothetical protein
MEQSEIQLANPGILRLTEGQIAHPYEVISDFFLSDHLSTYRKYITEMLKNASQKSVWKKDDPGELLLFYETIEGLIEAVYLIHQPDRKKKEEQESILNNIEVIEQNPIDSSLYYSGSSTDTVWDCFPRYLSKKEFINPYKVFGKFFRYQPLEEWKKLLHRLFEYALLSDSTFDANFNIDYLAVDSYLKKLVEAAHLIFVRKLME